MPYEKSAEISASFFAGGGVKELSLMKSLMGWAKKVPTKEFIIQGRLNCYVAPAMVFF
jgi:hypothetical protein